MAGLVTPVKPAFPKPAEPDPRLARLADRIKQVRHEQALRFLGQTRRSKDLH